MVALEATMHRLIGDGCEQILIEARNPVQDDRDRALVLDVLRAYRSRDLVYEWRQKSDELRPGAARRLLSSLMPGRGRC